MSRHLLVRWKEGPYEKIVIVFDKALTKKEQDAYFAWAKYVSLERSELRPLKRLEGIPNFEFNVFEP